MGCSGRLELARLFPVSPKDEDHQPSSLQTATSSDPVKTSLGIGQDVPAFSQARQYWEQESSPYLATLSVNHGDAKATNSKSVVESAPT